MLVIGLLIFYHFTNIFLEFNFLSYQNRYLYEKKFLMDKQIAIQKAAIFIKKLPDNNVEELLDFAAFLLSKNEDKLIQKEIYNHVENSKSFEWLKEEEDLYTPADYKVNYHAKR